MKTEKFGDVLELTVQDDISYIVTYRKKGTNSGGVDVSANGMDLMALTTANVINTLKTINDPYLQAAFFASLFDMVKIENALNPLVDVAVSFDGEVYRK
ncbi:MAG: hypothetical protein IKO56_00890 [Alphaproteobacteria bacterium]|nr:hypothetical protein [Alphaproteobacteria bacterium]